MGSRFPGGYAFVLLDRIAKSGASNWLGLLLNIFLDAVFPPKCLVCSRLIKPANKSPGNERLPNAATEISDPFAESYRLLTSFCCLDCMSACAAISSPMCTCCGVPFKSRHIRIISAEIVLRDPKNSGWRGLPWLVINN